MIGPRAHVCAGVHQAVCMCARTGAYMYSGAQVLTCVPGMCGVRGWQPEPAPPAPATPASNLCSSSPQATPWTQMQVVRGRGSRATDGALRPTPTAPRQVGLIPPGPCQAALPLSCTHPGPGLLARALCPRPASPGVPLYLCAPPSPPPAVTLKAVTAGVNVSPAGKKP